MSDPRIAEAVGYVQAMNLCCISVPAVCTRLVPSEVLGQGEQSFALKLGLLSGSLYNTHRGLLLKGGGDKSGLVVSVVEMAWNSIAVTTDTSLTIYTRRPLHCIFQMVTDVECELPVNKAVRNPIPASGQACEDI